jgi:hypothetical protein
MNRWFVKTLQWLLIAVVLIFVLVPSRLEGEFVKYLYGVSPVLCYFVVAPFAGLMVVGLWLWVQEFFTKKKKQKPELLSRPDTLV